jgi:putative salt-induced outer membrane protein
MRLSALTLVALAPAALASQEPPPKPLTFTADFGLVNTAGNTDVTTVNAGEKIAYTRSAFTLSQSFAVVYGRTAGVATTSLWKAGVRGDYKLHPRVGVFALGAFERNTFAGIDRRFEEAAGLAATLIDGGGNKLDAEAGASMNQQRSTTAVSNSFVAGRAALMYRRAITEAAFARLATEFLPNFEASDDYRVNGEAELVAPLSSRVALKMSYVVRFDNLPEPGFVKTDRLLTTGLQVVF